MEDKKVVWLLFLVMALCQSVMGIHIQVKLADDIEKSGSVSVMPLYEDYSAVYSPLYTRHILEYNTGTLNRLRGLMVKDTRGNGEEAVSRLTFDQVKLLGTGSIVIELFPNRTGLYKARCFGSTDILFKSFTKVDCEVEPEVISDDADWALL